MPPLRCVSERGKNPSPTFTDPARYQPNEITHFDFLYMGQGVGDFKYTFVLRDDLSTYMWLCPAERADSESAAEEISRWIRVFTAMPTWVSDQASHFKNQLMEALAKNHRIKHIFTVAYSPWVNGTVENCMRHILKACRALLSELKLGPQDWPHVLGIIMTILNQAPLRRLGLRKDGTYRTPLEVMTGLHPVRTQLRVTSIDGHEVPKTPSIEALRAQQLLNIEELQEVFDQMHKATAERSSKNSLKQIKAHNKKTNIICPKFEVGDFVLVRRAQDKGHKLAFKEIGPRRITCVISDLVYAVAGLLDEKEEQIHAARLRLYRAKEDGTGVSKELLEYAEHLEAKYEIIEKFLDISEAPDGIFVQVQWLGLPDKRDWTWNKVEQMYEDVPDKLQEFLCRTRKKKLVKKAQELISKINS